MKTSKEIDQLKDQIVANYQDQVDLLKSINETNNTIIAAQKEYIGALEQRIDDITLRLQEFQILLLKSL
jgi:hypothetical protein